MPEYWKEYDKMHDLDKIFWQGYDKGVQQTLLDLADIYENIKETDTWKEAFGESENAHD